MRTHPDYIPVKNIIRYKLFPLLRKRGFVARMNFSCCASCASYELAQVAKDNEKSKVVFYHKQSTERFKRNGAVYLHYYSTLDDEKETTKVGSEISSLANNCGLNVKWNGKGNTAIEVFK